MYKFTICEENDIPWTQIESCSDSNIFHTRDWMKFLIVCKGLKPFVVRIHLDKKLIGFFIGYKFKKIGLNIIGSPFEGWTTSYQGICSLYSLNKKQRISIYKKLSEFCLKYCILLQFLDWNLYIVKSRPSRPTRRWVKITGPPGIFIRISRATISNAGHNNKRPKSEAVRSKRYFI